MTSSEQKLLDASYFTNWRRVFEGHRLTGMRGQLERFGRPKPVEYSAIIPCFYRTDRLIYALQTFGCAAMQCKKDWEVCCIDTSIRPVNRGAVSRFAEQTSTTAWYYHDPSLTQSAVRNFGINHLYRHSRYILFLDSDIYLSRFALRHCIEFLNGNTDVSGVAPFLYEAGAKPKAELRRHGPKVMPDACSLFSSPRMFSEQFLPTRYMRGAYLLRRESLNAHPRTTAPFLKQFIVWQNVPFFQTMRELGQVVGYLRRRAVFALHDGRADNAQLRYSMNDWSAQVLRALCILLHRNQLWKPEFASRNSRFLKELERVIKDHVNMDAQSALGIMIKVASLLSRRPFRIAKGQLEQLQSRCEDKTMQRLFDLLLESARAWVDMQLVQSLNPNVPF